jgi:hypothetical protein
MYLPIYLVNPVILSTFDLTLYSCRHHKRRPTEGQARISIILSLEGQGCLRHSQKRKRSDLTFCCGLPYSEKTGVG